jgi:hypothetical protein
MEHPVNLNHPVYDSLSIIFCYVMSEKDIVRSSEILWLVNKMPSPNLLYIIN